MAQGKRRDGTGRGRGRPPGRELPFTSEGEAKAYLLQRGFTEDQLRVLVDMGWYATSIVTLMRAFNKDGPGRWLLQAPASNLLLRNRPDPIIATSFGATPAPPVPQEIGPLVESLRVVAQPLVLLSQLHEAVSRTRNFTRQQPELWKAMQEWKHAEQFTAGLILVILERLGWPLEGLNEKDHLALALYIGVRPGVLGHLPKDEQVDLADRRLDSWNRARLRAARSLLPQLRQLLNQGALPLPSTAPEPAPSQQQTELAGTSPGESTPVSSPENPHEQGTEGR